MSHPPSQHTRQPSIRSPSLAGRLRFRNRDSTRNDSGCVRPFARRAPHTTVRIALQRNAVAHAYGVDSPPGRDARGAYEGPGSQATSLPRGFSPVSALTRQTRQWAFFNPRRGQLHSTMGLFQPPPWSTAPFTPPNPPDRSPDAALVWRILPACASRQNDSIALCDLSRAEICSGLHSCSWQLVARASSSTRSSSDIRAKAL